MAESWQADGVGLLTGNPMVSLSEEQLKKFTPESMHLTRVMDFDVRETQGAVGTQEGKLVLGADFGGDKGSVRLYEVQTGRLKMVGGYTDDIQGNDGMGYATRLEKAAEYAQIQRLPLGVAWGGPIEGTRMLYHPKAKTFYSEMESRFGGDFELMSPSVKAVLNDGPAGTISGALEAYRQYGATTVLFVINGGGIGMGVMKDGAIWASEAGHVEALPELNVYGQTEPCGLFDATYTCLERVGANKEGIETQWEAKTGSYMRARDIEDEYKKGNTLAAELYEHSAQVLAHVIVGATRALDIDIAGSATAIVGHGGAFKFPYYAERVKQLIQQTDNRPIRLITTKDYTDPNSNACLDGAAIAALTA